MSVSHRNIYFNDDTGEIEVIETFPSDGLNCEKRTLLNIKKDRLKNIYKDLIKYEQRQQS